MHKGSQAQCVELEGRVRDLFLGPEHKKQDSGSWINAAAQGDAAREIPYQETQMEKSELLKCSD